MTQFIIVPIFFLIALGIMWLTLYLGKYKQGDDHCCGGGHCSASGGHDHDDHVCSKEHHNQDNIPKLENIEVLNISK